jgi:predicted transcriptional regulator
MGYSQISGQVIIFQVFLYNQKKVRIMSKIAENTNDGLVTTVEVQKTETKKRFSIELSMEAYKSLQELAETSSRNMIDVIRFGIALYSIAQEAKEKGQSIGVVKEDKVIREILVP